VVSLLIESAILPDKNAGGKNEDGQDQAVHDLILPHWAIIAAL